MVCVFKFCFQLFTANIWQYDCVCVCVCIWQKERARFCILTWYLQLQTYLFSELSFVFSSVCRFLGICYVANHIVCKCEQLYFFTLTHMSLLSFFRLKSSSTKLNWLVESRHPYLIPKSRLLSLSTMFAICFYKCPLSEWDILYS